MTFSARVQEVQCKTGNHYKFYRAYTLSDPLNNDFRVVFNYGKIGSNGQWTPSQKFSTLATAMLTASNKIESKRRGGGSSVYETEIPDRELSVVPEDVLEKSGIFVDENARSQQKARLEVDAHARFAADADSLIRLITGPTELTGEVYAARSSLQDQLDELRNRLLASEGQMELINDVVQMKSA